MQHPVGTEQYRALVDQRRQELAAQLQRIAPGPREFVWELGAGHGHFLTAYAQKHPEKLCIGIDIASDRVERAARKRDRARLPNLHFLQAEARLFVETLPAGLTIAELFVLFPDPWPKSRHHKHRVMQPAFLDSVANHASAHCRLFFRTDFAPYFTDTLAVMRHHPRWQPVDEPWPFEFETVFQSRAATHQSLIARRRP